MGIQSERTLLFIFLSLAICLEGCKEEKDAITEQKTNNKSTEFVDPRDGTTYNTVKIGNQVWMAENLRYKAPNSWCYDDNQSNCDIHGRLYSWSDAMSACPDGWSLPSNTDFETLKQYIQENIGSPNVGTALKAKNFGEGEENAIPGTNQFGFNALASGDRVGKKYQFKNKTTYFWSATDEDDTHAYDWILSASQESFDHGNIKYSLKNNFFSVRCIHGSAAKEETSKEGVMTDERDGEIYKIVKIGNQTWMAENLRFKAKGSSCANGNCKEYGRLYPYSKNLCPRGWHIPSDQEWKFLMKYAEKNSSDADAALRSKNWKKHSYSVWLGGDDETVKQTIPSGTDEFGFNALSIKYHAYREGIDLVKPGAAFWSSDRSKYEDFNNEDGSGFFYCQNWHSLGWEANDACEDASCSNFEHYSCGFSPDEISVRCIKN